MSDKASADKTVKKGSLRKRALKKWDRFWTDYTMARKKAKHRRKVGRPEKQTAAFVVGCQRSGTDMTIKTLDRSVDVDRFDEYDERAFEDCRIKDREICERLVAESNAKCIIFKPVCDSHRATDLLNLHPGSKVIWIYRRYQDVANSAVERWGNRTQQWVQDVLKGGGDWGWRQWNKEKVTDEVLAQVKEVCPADVSEHGAAAIFWYMRNQTYFDQDLQNHPDCLLVRYEEAVASPTEEFRRMCDFLGIDYYPDMTSKIFSSSVGKRKSPPIAEPIEELCQAMLDRLDAARAAPIPGS